MQRRPETTPDNQHQSYALLTIEQRLLLLPQREVRTLESVLDMRADDPPDYGVGWLPFEQQDWPVYSMDAALNPLSTAPAKQRICVLLTLPEGHVGLLCSDVAIAPGSTFDLRPLPRAMAKPHRPFTALTVVGDRIGLVSAATVLAAYFNVNLEALSAT